jgi:diacylglycerol kinase family enzyme
MRSPVRKVSCLVNEASGSVPQDGGALLERCLKEAGYDVVVFRIEEGKLRETLDALSAAKPSHIVIWGGDGTVNATVERFRATKTTLIALPGGTMNLLHKRLNWQDLTLGEIPTLLQTGVERTMTLGEAGGEVFSVAAMAGALTEVARSREALRQGDVLGAISDVVGGGALDLKSRIRITGVRKGKALEPIEATAVAIFVTNDGEFEVGAINPDTLFDLAGTGLGALIDDWRTAAGMSHYVADKVMLSSLDGAPIPMRLDGEETASVTALEISLSGDKPTILTWENQ